MNIAQIDISVFPSATSTAPTTVKLGAFLKSKKHLVTIQALRNEKVKDRRTLLKKKLPAATISGTFRERNIAGIEQYNGLVCLDFDAADNPGLNPVQMKERLAELTEVAFAATSVGGEGVYAIVPTNLTDPSRHSALVMILEKLFNGLGLVTDKSCKDVSRLRFVSYDERPVINTDPAIFDALRWLAIAEETAARDIKRPRPFVMTPTNEAKGYPDGTTRRKVEDYLQAIESGCNDLTANYDDWLRLGFALANEFGLEGEGYFQRLSQFNPKYDQAECAKKFEELRKNGRRVRIGTFFKICNLQGIRL